MAAQTTFPAINLLRARQTKPSNPKAFTCNTYPSPFRSELACDDLAFVIVLSIYLCGSGDLRSLNGQLLRMQLHVTGGRNFSKLAEFH